jgi:hypothetical protein
MTTTLTSPDQVVERDAVAYRTLVVRMTAGLDGVVRVVTMLRGRRYRVRHLTVDVHEGASEGELRATVLLTDAEVDLLEERLRRMPAVVGVRSR